MSKQHDQQPKGLLRQGDVLLVPADKPRARATRVGRTGGRLILAEGEVTGHAHAILDRRARLFSNEISHRWGVPPTETRCLVVRGKDAVALTHEEHDPLLVPPGVYEVRRQREYAPQRTRLVND